MNMMRKMVIYFFGNVATKIITFLLMPVYTYYINPEGQGLFGTLSSGLMIIVPICMISCWSGMMRFMFDHEDSKGKQGIFANGFALMLLLSPLYLLGVWALKGIIELSGETILDGQALLVVGLYGAAQYVQNLYQSAARGLALNRLYMVTGVVNTFVTLLCNLVLIVVFQWGYIAMLIAPAIGAFTQAVIIECRTGLLLRIRWRDISSRVLGQLTRYCWPLAINSAAYALMSTGNIMVVQNVLGLEAAGLFTTANRFAMILQLVTTVFALAWEETAYANASSSKRGEIYRTTLQQFMLILGLGMAVLIPATKVIFPFMISDPGYFDAIWVLPVSYAATMAAAVSVYYGNIYSAEKQTATIFTSTMLGAAVNIGAMVLLIPRIGLQGAILAMFLGYSANIVMRHIRIQRFCRIPFPWKTLVQVAALNGLSCVVYYAGNGWYNLAMAGLTGLYALYTLRDLIRSILQKIKSRRKSEQDIDLPME